MDFPRQLGAAISQPCIGAPWDEAPRSIPWGGEHSLVEASVSGLHETVGAPGLLAFSSPLVIHWAPQFLHRHPLGIASSLRASSIQCAPPIKAPKPPPPAYRHNSS